MRKTLLMLVALVAILPMTAALLPSCPPDSFEEFWLMTQGQPDEMRIKSMISMMNQGVEESDDRFLLDDVTGRLIYLLHVPQEMFEQGKLSPDNLENVRTFLLANAFNAVGDITFCDFMRAAASAGHGYEVRLQAVENPSMTASVTYAPDEVLRMCDEYEEYCNTDDSVWSEDTVAYDYGYDDHMIDSVDDVSDYVGESLFFMLQGSPVEQEISMIVTFINQALSDDEQVISNAWLDSSRRIIVLERANVDFASLLHQGERTVATKSQIMKVFVGGSDDLASIMGYIADNGYGFEFRLSASSGQFEPIVLTFTPDEIQDVLSE